MDTDERELLERILDLSEENNKLLRKMERANRWSLIFKIIYWVFVIGAAIGIYYYIQPYEDSLVHTYQNARAFFGH